MRIDAIEATAVIDAIDPVDAVDTIETADAISALKTPVRDRYMGGIDRVMQWRRWWTNWSAACYEHLSDRAVYDNRCGSIDPVHRRPARREWKSGERCRRELVRFSLERRLNHPDGSRHRESRRPGQCNCGGWERIGKHRRDSQRFRHSCRGHGLHAGQFVQPVQRHP